MLWQNGWGGPVEPEYGYEVRQTPDKGYIIAATTHSFTAGECDAWIIKTDANGDTLWTKLYGENNWNRIKAVELTPDSGYIFVGWTGSSPSASNLWVIKTNANGDTLWTKVYGGTSYDYGTGVKQTWDGGYIICGISFGPGAHDMWLLKTNSSGDTLWTRTYGTPSTDWGYAVQQTFDGGYIAVGMYNDWLLGDQMWAVRVAGEQTPHVTVISPNGCEDLLIGDTCDITWFAADNFGVDSINILYSTDAGMSWDTIATSEPNDSLYEWIIPDTPSDSCLVKVLAYDSSFNIGEDQSDSLFRISAEGIEVDISSPNSSPLFQCMPNPFSKLITINFCLGHGAKGAELKIYDVSGRIVKVFNLVSGILPLASSVCWDGTDASGKDVPAGVYFVWLETQDYTITKKAILLR